jgi:hypothetical protein
MLKRLAVLILIAAVCSAMALGRNERLQASSSQGGGNFDVPQMDEQSAIIIMTAILELNRGQQQQLRTNFDDALKTAAPIATQIAAAKDALFQAAKSGTSEDQIQKLAAQEGALESQMAVLQAHTFAKVWGMLTDQQKTQVDSTMFEQIGEFLSKAGETTAPAATTETAAGAPGAAQ